MRIEVVSLDLDNTLIKNLSPPEIFYRILVENNVYIDFRRLLDSWNSIKRSVELGLRNLPAPVSKEALYRYYVGINYRVLSEVGVKDYRLAEEVYCKWFKWSKLYDDVNPTLDFLYRNNYNIVVSSNNLGSDVSNILKSKSIIDKVKYIFTPDKTGFLKFSPLFYKNIIKFLDIPKERILHIGDSLENDYISAMEAGIHSILLNRSNKKYPENIKVIKSLIEITDILGELD